MGDTRTHNLAGCRRRHGDAGPAAGRPCGPDCGCRCHPASVDRDELRHLAEAATPGPWGWRGHVDGCVELVTLHSGQLRVVSAMRAQPCIVELADGAVALTAYACDDCKDKTAEVARTKNGDLWEGYRCAKPENLGTVWLWDGKGFVRPANHWAVKERPYRSDVAWVDHPDARWLAAASPEVVLALLDRITELERTEFLAHAASAETPEPHEP